jgi:ABC-type transport system involved in multi-copper enzyme maturation permease subunit
MNTVYRLTLRQLSGKWRLGVMLILGTLPVFMTMLMLGNTSPSVGEFEQVVLGGMLAGSIIPLVVLAIGAVAFSNEVEDRTLANLTLSPLPRSHIATAKLLAVITISLPLATASAFATAHIAFLGDPVAVVAITVSAVAAVVLYSAAFTWLGLMTTQAIGVGLLYVVLWEGLFTGFVEGARLLSIRYHAVALMHGLDDRRFPGGAHLSLGAATTLSVALVAVFLWLTIRRLRRMDVP